MTTRKIIAVPVDKLHPFYEGVRSYKDLPVTLIDQIAHFFQHYKDLEKGKWVTIVNWVGTERAEKMILEGIDRAASAGDDVAAHFVASGALKSAKRRKKLLPRATDSAAPRHVCGRRCK